MARLIDTKRNVIQPRWDGNAKLIQWGWGKTVYSISLHLLSLHKRLLSTPTKTMEMFGERTSYRPWIKHHNSFYFHPMGQPRLWLVWSSNIRAGERLRTIRNTGGGLILCGETRLARRGRELFKHCGIYWTIPKNWHGLIFLSLYTWTNHML